MNKIRVNMAVEPNDIQTLHCSQYDTEERKFSVDLHENGVGVSPSSISNQLVYKSFKGGTEQILPTNTSTPSTSPIIADIQYKDGLREDEEFLYRESPSSVDGYAKIKEIRGNTIVWNQLAKYASMASVTACGLTCVNNNDGSFTITGTFNNTGDRNFYGFISIISAIKDHKYLIISSGSMMAGFVFGSATGQRDATKYVVTAGSTGNMETAIRLIDSKANNGQQVNEKIWVTIFDLTQMGLDSITTVEEFEALFPLSYYAYDSGSLLSFNGSGIKTKKADDTDLGTLSLPISTYFPTGLKSAGSIYDQLDETGYITRVGEVDLGNLTWTYNSTYQWFSSTNINTLSKAYADSVVPNAICKNYLTVSASTASTVSNNMVLSINAYGNLRIRDTSQGTDPSAFKTAMSGVYLYYELATPLENYGVVDLGSLEWTYRSDSHAYFYSTGIASDVAIPSSASAVAELSCDKYVADSQNHIYSHTADKTIAIADSGQIWVYDTSYTDATTFKNAMSGVYLLYEKSNPQGLKTASIVTNYGEMPLYNDNGELKADCIADISQNSGFQIAKVKLKDENGEIYSNPFQIHTERSPQ